MTKDELRQIRYLDHVIDSKMRTLENLKARRFSIKGAGIRDDKTTSTGFARGAYQEDLILKIIDLEREVTVEIDRLVDLKKKAHRELDKLTGAHRALMYMRYFDGLPWETIASRLGYSARAIYKLHGGALEILRREK